MLARAGRTLDLSCGEASSRGAPASRSISSVWSRVGDRLDHGRRSVPRRRRPASRTARLDLGARHGQRVVASPPAVCRLDDGQRQVDRRSSPSGAPIWRQRLRNAAPSAAADSDSSPVSVEALAVLERRAIPTIEARERARVAAVDRPPACAGRVGPAPVTRTSSSPVLVDRARRARRTAASVDSVSPERPKPRTLGRRRRRSAPSSSARCEIDLSPGHGEVALYRASRPARSSLDHLRDRRRE